MYCSYNTIITLTPACSSHRSNVSFNVDNKIRETDTIRQPTKWYFSVIGAVSQCHAPYVLNEFPKFLLFTSSYNIVPKILFCFDKWFDHFFVIDFVSPYYIFDIAWMALRS